MQMLGLHWAGANAGKVKSLAAPWLPHSARMADGRRTPTSRAMRTLPANHFGRFSEAGVLRAAGPAYQRGVKFLLSTQWEDGSWYVRWIPVRWLLPIVPDVLQWRGWASGRRPGSHMQGRQRESFSLFFLLGKELPLRLFRQDPAKEDADESIEELRRGTESLTSWAGVMTVLTALMKSTVPACRRSRGG